MSNMEERKQAIINVLKGVGPVIDARVWEKIHEKGIMSKTLYYTCRRILKKAEEIGVKNVGRQVWLYLPEDEKLFRERAGLMDAVEESERLPYRLTHTKVLKEKVIKPWLEQLPSTVGLKITYPKKELLVLKEPLFLDFKKHIKFEPNPFVELEKFMELRKNFLQKKRTIKLFILANIISVELEEAPASFEVESGIVKEHLDYMDEYDETRYSLYKWVTDMMIDLHFSGFDEEIFDKLYSDFYSYVKETASTYEYYVGNDDIYCGRILKEEMPKDKFKKEMDEIIKNILKQVKESEYLRDEIDSLYETERNMSQNLDNMRTSLEKHYRLTILPGDCEYYHWVSNKKI